MPTSPLPSLAETLRRVRETALGVRVLFRRGLVDIRHPGAMVKKLRIVDKAGPIVGALAPAVQADPYATALIDDRGGVTFAELDRQSNAAARALAGAGLRAGDTIGMLARDHRGAVLAMLAAGKLGLRLVLMNTGSAGPQLCDIVARENIAALMLDSEFLPLVAALPESMVRFVLRGNGSVGDTAVPSLATAVVKNSGKRLPMPSRPGTMVLLTSGTTGTPKGAPRDKVSPLISAQVVDRIPFGRDGTMVCGAPIFHGTGLMLFTLGVLLGKKIILTGGRFDVEQALRSIAEHRADTLVVVPTLLQRIVDLDDEIRARYDTSSLRVIFCAGSAIPPDLVRRTMAAFGDVLYNLYGSTEVAVASVATPSELRIAPETAGRPPVGVRVALYDEKRRRITRPGVVGTVFVSNEHSFSAYTDGRTKERVNGLMSTGDMGYFDEDGLLFIVGRDDDMIVSGGENVFPQEVENLLTTRPDIVEAAVGGVDDPEFGKRLRAYIVCKPGVTLDAEEIRQFVRDNLARYKVPRDIEFVDELPRNATGKVLRRALSPTD